jgi:hypothetical protein
VRKIQQKNIIYSAENKMMQVITMRLIAITVISLFAATATGTSYAQNSAEEDSACDTIAGILQSVSGSTMERYYDQFEDHIANKTRSGCLVKIKGTWSAITDDIHPPNVLYPNSKGPLLKQDGWQLDNRYGADGKDGTSFAIRNDDIICLVSGKWDGGDDSDPDYVPGDEYEMLVGCALNPENDSE